MAISTTRFFIAIIGLLFISFVIVPAQTSVHFAVIGDYGSAGQPELDVSNLVKSWSPDFIVTTGDNNYDNGAASTIDPNIGQYYHEFISPYTGSYGSGDTVNRFFPCLGNHDWVAAGALPYLNYFTLPGNERYYDFVKGPVHFYSIDSDSHEPDGNSSGSTQGLWLQSALSSSTETWKIVYFHHPSFSSGSTHGSSIIMQWPFKQWGATTILTGHEHNYERLIENNLVYFVNGLGGRSLYNFGSSVTGSIVRYNANYGAMLVDANSDSIRFQFISRAGLVIDTYTILASSLIPPSQVIPEFPIDGSIDQSTPVTARWIKIPSALTYQLQLSTSASFTSPIVSDSTLLDTFKTLNNLALNTTYWWKVRAKNNAGWGPYSTAFTFTTWDIPGKVVLTFPDDGSVGLSNPPECRWERLSNSLMYEFEISPDSTFATFVFSDSTIVDTTYSPLGLDSLLTYFWRVRAKNNAGWGGYSDTWRFKISTAVSISGIVQKGWNMISVPLTVSDGRTLTLFPNATTQSWGWVSGNGYLADDTLFPGNGYWLKFDSARVVSVAGAIRTSDTLNVVKGWNLIGSLSTPIPVDSIHSIPPGIIGSKFFEYSHGYLNSSILVPMKGYWIKINQNGSLIMSPPPAFSPNSHEQ